MQMNVPQASLLSQTNLDTNFARSDISMNEISVAQAMCEASKHAKLTFLPNHHMNVDDELTGFKICMNAQDLASVIPMHNKMFELTSIYECVSESTQVSTDALINEHVKNIIDNYDLYQAN